MREFSVVMVDVLCRIIGGGVDRKIVSRDLVLRSWRDLRKISFGNGLKGKERRKDFTFFH